MKSQNFPLSIAQKDVLHECLISGDTPAFNIGGTIRLCDVDKDRVIASHKKLIASNDVFNLAIVKVEGDYFQTAYNESDDRIDAVDLRHFSDPISEAKRLIAKEFEKPINFLENTLHSAMIFQTADRDFFYMGKMHHIVIDGFGFGIWAKQIIDNIYGNSLHNDVPWQSFVESEQKKIDGKRHIKSHEYWEKKLCTDFAPVFKQRSVSKYSKRITHVFSKEDISYLNSVRENTGWTYPQQLLAIVSTIISKRFNISRLLVNEVYHNRRNFSEKSKIGFFAGESPIVIDFDCFNTFKEVVESCSNLQKEKFRLQNIGKKEIVNILRANGVLASEQISFNYIKMQPFYSPDGNEIVLNYYPHNHESLPFRVNVWEEHGGDSISLEVDYNIGFLNEDEVSKIIYLISSCVQKLSQNPDIGIKNIPSLTKEESKEIVKFSNLTPAVQVKYNTITDLLIHAVHSNPDGKALDSRGGSLTYQELYSNACLLACEVHNSGINPGQVIAIETEKTIEYMIQVWAIWLSGCAILPVDKSLGKENVEHMLRESKAAAFIVWKENRCGSKVERGPFTAESNSPSISVKKLRSLRNEKTLAYVMFTSGSTGMPKGVRINDGSLATKMLDATREYGLGKEERILQFSSLSFDISIEEIFLSISSAGLLILPQDDVKSVEGFTSYVIDYDVTTVSTPTSFFHHYVGNMKNSDPCLSQSKLRRFIVGGETLEKSFCKKWLSAFPDIELINTYGPTEATITASFLKVKEEHINLPEIPIGKPFQSNSLAILSDKRFPVPCGVTGHLYIGGDIVSEGYTDKSKNTPFEKFSLLGSPNVRWYKSGDLAYWDEFGNVVYEGRSDDQLKLNGYRMSLSEISTIIQSVDGVKQAVTIHDKAENSIHVFVIREISSIESDIVSGILKSVPNFVHPSVTFISEFPKTVTGKTDRKALLSLAAVKKSSLAETQTEIEVSKLLSKYITVKEIDVNKTLYQMGGTSLHLISLSKDISETFDINLAVDKIIALQTVKKISAYIDDINSIKLTNESDDSKSGFSMTI